VKLGRSRVGIVAEKLNFEASTASPDRLVEKEKRLTELYTGHSMND
jgi:hypothetical protein